MKQCKTITVGAIYFPTVCGHYAYQVPIASGSNSQYIIQFDVVPKKIDGFIQVFYRDQPVSDLIPYQAYRSCYENLMILDVQQVKPLPGGQWLYSPQKAQ